MEIAIGDILICKYDNSELEVTEMTSKGFKYKNHTNPIRVPRLNICGTGEGEIYKEIFYMYSKKELTFNI